MRLERLFNIGDILMNREISNKSLLAVSVVTMPQGSYPKQAATGHGSEVVL
jgi:hypothetical protein